jgi:hypothetical protein
MVRHRPIWLLIGLFVLSSLACNAFAGQTEPGVTLPPPPTTAVNTTPAVDGSDDETNGPAPTATLPGEVAAEEGETSSGEPMVRVLVDLNVRGGPGVQYERVGFLLENQTVPILGRDPDTGWWKIECPPRAEGSECWISGGSQYSAATNTEGVPVAAVPPTPTPVPPTATPAPSTEREVAAGRAGLLAYVDDDGLWVAVLDLQQDPPQAVEPRQLVDSSDVQLPFISPDGQKVAYLAGGGEENERHVIDLDDGDDTTLVNSADDLPLAAEEDSDDVAVLIGQVQWLADSQTLAFNTDVSNLVGPGFASQEDLWTVTLDGELTEQFEAGTGGGAFDISEENRVLMGQTEAVVRARLGGGEPETVIEFDFINTASEYAYYPQPQWTADGGRAYVAIPSQEQFAPRASTALWRIPATGPAEPLEILLGNTLFNPVVWSPDGSVLAYVFLDMGTSNPLPVLMLAEASGHSRSPYADGQQLTFHGWSQNEDHFLYAGNGFYAIGEVGELPMEIVVPDNQQAVAGQWITETTFVVVVGSTGAWDIVSGNASGDTTTLLSDVGRREFDVWGP